MKDILFVQRNWRQGYFDPLAEAEALDAETQANIRYALGKEIEWMIRIPDPHQLIQLRRDKIDQLVTAHGVDAVGFDPYYIYRRGLYDYALS